MSLELYVSVLVISLPVAKTPSTFQVIAHHAADANVICHCKNITACTSCCSANCHDCLKILLNVINITVCLEVTNANFTAIGGTVLQCVYTFFHCFSFPASPYALLEFILILVMS